MNSKLNWKTELNIYSEVEWDCARDVSIKNKVKEFKGTLVEGSEKFYPCTDKFDAFIKEAELMSKHLKDGENC